MISLILIQLCVHVDEKETRSNNILLATRPWCGTDLSSLVKQSGDEGISGGGILAPISVAFRCVLHFPHHHTRYIKLRTVE